MGWLKAVALGSQGASFELLRTLYISLIRSKLEFALLLKTEKSYLDMLERLQRSALRIAAGAFRSTPNDAITDIFDLPPFHALIQAKGYQLYANFIDGSIPEVSASFESRYDHFQEELTQFDLYNDSPLSFMEYAQQETAFILETTDYVEGLVSVNPEATALYRACFEIETPKAIARDKWKPEKERKNEISFYSDGGFKEDGWIGSAAGLGPNGAYKAFSFYPCASSTQAELEGLDLAVTIAVDQAHHDKGIAFILDSAAVIKGFKQWCFKKISSTQHRILRNLAILMERGNKVRFRWVPSHINEEEKWRDTLCRLNPLEIEGNRMVDQQCTIHLKTYPPTNPRHHSPHQETWKMGEEN